MNYYDDLLGLKPSLLEPINPDKTRRMGKYANAI